MKTKLFMLSIFLFIFFIVFSKHHSFGFTMTHNNYVIQRISFGNISKNQSSNTSNILNILKLEAHGYSNECNNIYIKDTINSISREITLGHYMNAAVSAKLEAHYQSYCYLKNHNITRLSLAAGNVGEFLATYVLFWHKIATTSASILVSAKYAEELLKYSNTQPKLISELYKSGLVKGPKLEVSNNVALNTTVLNAAEEDMNNSFAFNHLYLNKTLELTGKVSWISSIDSGNGAIIGFHGIRGYYAYCNITNKNYLNQVYNIKKGQTVSIIGVYQQKIIGLGINLYQCRIQS